MTHPDADSNIFFVGKFPQLSYEIVLEEHFPGGVICLDCKRPLEPGQPFQTRITGMTGEVSNEEIICVYC